MSGIWHTECGRCGAQFSDLTGLLAHYQVHGGWATRYPDEKPLMPNPARMDEERARGMRRYRRAS